MQTTNPNKQEVGMYSVDKIGEHLSAKMEETGISLKKQSDRLKLSPNGLRNILLGRSIPLIETVKRIEKVTGKRYLIRGRS